MPMNRIIAMVVLIGCVSPLLLAARLDPHPAGLGTHTQMGLHACAWHQTRGYACPTCGWTTAMALATDGRLFAAFFTQPTAAFTALGLAMATWVAGWVALTGASIGPWLRPLANWKTPALCGILVMLGWAYVVIMGR